MTDKTATTSYPIHPLLTARWSPRAFDGAVLDNDHVMSLFEAARWAASSRNIQPWRFILAGRDDDGFAKILEGLAASNARWARHASALIVTLAVPHDDRGRANRHAWHDVGQAIAQLTAQATAMELGVHQMAGIDRGVLRNNLAIDQNLEIVSVLAVGRPTDADELPDDLAQREIAPRKRKPLSELVFVAQAQKKDST